MIDNKLHNFMELKKAFSEVFWAPCILKAFYLLIEEDLKSVLPIFANRFKLGLVNTIFLQQTGND